MILGRNPGAAPTIIHQEPTGQVQLMEFESRFFDIMSAHFGGRFREYREAWLNTSQFNYLPDFPLSLDLEINASCNLRCVMCVRNELKESSAFTTPQLMTRELYERLMAEAGTANMPAMTLGFLSEPLLHPNLAEMIALARRSGVMDIRLGTNGLLLNKKISQALISAGLTRLEVSVDALTAEAYSQIRPEGRLEVVVRNVLDFLELRRQAHSDLPVLRVSFLRLPYNDFELEGFLEFWRTKADLFAVQTPIYYEDAPISRDLVLRPQAIPEDFHCAQPWQRLIVRADGDAFPCCSLYGLNMKLGSVLNYSITDLWSDPQLGDLRLLLKAGRHEEKTACHRCAQATYMHAEFNKNGECS